VLILDGAIQCVAKLNKSIVNGKFNKQAKSANKIEKHKQKQTIGSGIGNTLLDN
jgi:hypothetical protein